MGMDQRPSTLSIQSEPKSDLQAVEQLAKGYHLMAEQLGKVIVGQHADRFDEKRFGQAGDADEEHVALTEHCGEDLFDDIVLADDHLAELFGHEVVAFGELLDGL